MEAQTRGQRPALVIPAGQPLRVAVYSHLADEIRSGRLPLGSLLASETELGVQLSVSRTVVREALMLLEEDGLIRTKRGIGRFVSPELPRFGLERFQPWAIALALDGVPVEMVPVSHHTQQATDFDAAALKLEFGSSSWFRETVARRNDAPIALIHEHTPSGDDLAGLDQKFGDLVSTGDIGPATLLDAIWDGLQGQFTDARTTLSIGVAGKARGQLLEIKPTDSVIVLTQFASIGGRPAYVAKVVLPPTTTAIEVTQAI
jgi:GntR family transcriptional regulator